MHSANAYITPADQFSGRDNKIHSVSIISLHLPEITQRDQIKWEPHLGKLKFTLMVGKPLTTHRSLKRFCRFFVPDKNSLSNE